MTNLRLPPFRAFQSHLLPPGKPGPPDGSWVGFQSILYKSGNLGDQIENRAGWPGFSASSRDAVTEEERGNSTLPGARPGPNHNLMFCLTKDLQVAEIKCHYCWTGFGRNT